MLKRIIATSLLLFAFSNLQAALLVKNGTAKAQIVLPKKALYAEKTAASELRFLIKKSSGAELPIVTADKLQPGLLPIRIGRAAAGESVAPNVGRIISNDRELLLYGGDNAQSMSTSAASTGSLFAVYELAEKILQVRWLWPDDRYGIVVKKMADIDIPEMDEKVVPALENVRIRHFPIQWGRRAARIHSTPIILPRGRGGHAFVGWYKIYGKTHPEFFALSAKGRLNKNDGPMCVANPALHKEIIRIWQEERARNPGKRVDINLCENDCKGSCICKLCKAWDAPDSPEGDVSERYARFYKTIYEIASKIDPEVRVYGYAYSNYVNAPRHFKLPKNVMISYVPSPMQPYSKSARKLVLGRINDWVKSGCTLSYRPNLLGGYAMPEQISDDYYAEFQAMRQANMKNIDIDGPNCSFATQGVYLYVLARMMLNPTAKLEDLKEEYYSAFGPCAKEIKAYWEYWNRYTLDNAELFHSIPKKYNPIRFGIFFGFHYAFYAHRLFPDKVFVPAIKLIDKAIEAAKNSPEDLERVKFLKAGLLHARLCASACAVFNDPKSSTAERMTAMTAVHDFRKNSLPQWAAWTKRFVFNGQNEQIAWTFNTFDPNSMMKLPIEWKFCADPQNTGERHGFHTADFDDSKWRMVKTDRLLEFQGIKNYHYAWYRLKVDIPKQFLNHRTVIHFGAIDESCDLWINGKKAGSFKFDQANDPDSWKNPMEFDITDHIPADGKITIALRVLNEQARGGLWRPSQLNFFKKENSALTINPRTAPMPERSLKTFGSNMTVVDGAYRLTGSGRRRYAMLYLDMLKNPGDRMLTVTVTYRMSGKFDFHSPLLERGVGKKNVLKIHKLKLKRSAEWKTVTQEFPLLPETKRLDLQFAFNMQTTEYIEFRDIKLELNVKKKGQTKQLRTSTSSGKKPKVKKNNAAAAPRPVTTAPAAAQPAAARSKAAGTFVIAHVSDVHTTPGSTGIELVHRMIDELNSNPDIDAVVITGDWGASATPEEFKLSRSFYDRITKPKLTVPGNHEVQWGFDGGGRYANAFGKTPYSMKVGNVLFLGLNTSPAFQFITSYIRSSELEFVKQQLAGNKDASLVIVAGHYSPNPKELSNWFDLPRVLRQSGVKRAVILSGHIHRFHLMRWAEYPGLAGRALRQDKSNRSAPPGYVLIRIAADGSVTASEKFIGKAEQPPRYKFRLGHPGSLKMIKSARDLRDPRFAIKLPPKTLRKIDFKSTTTSGVAVDGNILIAAGDDKSLKAYDLNSREEKILWQIHTSGIIYGALSAGNGVVAAGMDDSRIAGFSTADGRELWSVKANCPVLSPGVLRDGIYYTGLGKGAFAAIEMSSGKVLWQSSCGNGAFQAQPDVTADLIVTGCWDGSVYALHRRNGKVLWKWDTPKKRERSAPGNSRPFIAGDRVIVSSFDGGGVVDAANGKTLFYFKGRESLGFSPEHKTGFTRTGKGLLAFDLTAANFTRRFETNNSNIDYSPLPMLLINGKLWAASNNGKILIINPANGNVERSFQCGFSALVGILPVEDTVWVTLNEGTALQFPANI